MGEGKAAHKGGRRQLVVAEGKKEEKRSGGERKKKRCVTPIMEKENDRVGRGEMRVADRVRSIYYHAGRRRPH